MASRSESATDQKMTAKERETMMASGKDQSTVQPEPWKAGASSPLNRAIGSAERLLSHLRPQRVRPGPGPNANFDSIDASSSSSLLSAATLADRSLAKPSSSAASSSISKPAESVLGRQQHQMQRVAIANIKYKNEAGRKAVIACCKQINHDFGVLTSIINATLNVEDLQRLSENPDISWVDKDGAVFFIQPWNTRKS